jgi:hypothetical protein
MQQGGTTAAPKLYRLTISKVTGTVVFITRKTFTKTGTLEELEEFYREVRRHNMRAGWWAFPAGLIWNPMAMSRNKKALAQLHRLAAANSAPANTASIA